MRRKEFWEKRKIKSASISFKRTISLSIEDELDVFRGECNLGGWTDLNMKFLYKKSNQSKKEFEEDILKYILKKIRIKKGEYSKNFRKFLAEEILRNVKTKEQKERLKRYIKDEEFK